jgi:protein-S-isoprenylcysteine O-methyltransferase Ste14
MVLQNQRYLVQLILPVTVFTVVITGYGFAVGDQAMFIPIIRRILDPSLYPGDYLFQQPGNRSSVLLPVVAHLSRVIPLAWVFFIGYMAAMFGLFWTVYRLACALFGNTDVASIAVLLACISRRQDYAVTTQEGFFTLQPAAMPFCLMALSFFVEGRYALAAVFNGIAFLLHPIAAMPVLMLLSLYLILNVRRVAWRTVLKALGLFLLIASPLFIMTGGSVADRLSAGGLFKIASTEWMDIQYVRNEYTFPLLWDRASWRHLLSIGTLFAASIFLKITYAGMEGKDHRSLWIVLVSLISLATAHTFGSVIPVGLIFQFHLYRGLYMLMYVAFIYAAFVIWEEYRQSPSAVDRAIVIGSAGAIATGDDILTLCAIVGTILLWMRTKVSARLLSQALRAFGIALSGYIVFRASKNLMFLTIIGTPVLLFAALEILRRAKAIKWDFVKANRFVFVGLLLMVVATVKIELKGLGITFPFAKPNDPWTQVQYWAAASTPKEAVFIVPPDIKGFRNFSERTSVGDQKDGGSTSYSESYAKEWARRMKELESYDNFQEGEFLNLAQEYAASFVVTRSGQMLSFPKVFENNDFRVYEIPTHLAAASERGARLSSQPTAYRTSTEEQLVQQCWDRRGVPNVRGPFKCEAPQEQSESKSSQHAGAIYFNYPYDSHFLDQLWEVLCLLISLSGLFVRMLTVGYAASHTYGKNNTEQISALNTTGMYSVVRNPLYLGNFLILLGVMLFPRIGWIPVMYTFVFALYYEQIIFAEEAFLRHKFGTQYFDWAADTRAYLPRFSGWKSPNMPFNWRRVLRREKHGLIAIVFSMFLLEVAGDLYIGHGFEIDMMWAVFLSLAGSSYFIIRLLHD